MRRLLLTFLQMLLQDIMRARFHSGWTSSFGGEVNVEDSDEVPDFGDDGWLLGPGRESCSSSGFGGEAGLSMSKLGLCWILMATWLLLNSADLMSPNLLAVTGRIRRLRTWRCSCGTRDGVPENTIGWRSLLSSCCASGRRCGGLILDSTRTGVVGIVGSTRDDGSSCCGFLGSWHAGPSTW